MGERNYILKEAVQLALDKEDLIYTEEYFDDMTLFITGLEWENGKTVMVIPCREYGMPQLSLRAVTKLPIKEEELHDPSFQIIINALNQKFPFYRTFINDENNLEIAGDFLIYGNTARIRTFVENKIEQFIQVPFMVESELERLLMKVFIMAD